jgi:hypothetical protein
MLKRALLARVSMRRYHHETGPNVIVRAVSRDGGISIKVVAATGLVLHMCSRNRCSPVAAAALGRATIDRRYVSL